MVQDAKLAKRMGKKTQLTDLWCWDRTLKITLFASPVVC